MRHRASQKLFRAAPWATLEGGIAALYGFSAFLIIGKYIDPDQLGTAGAAIAVAGIMELATSGGIQETVIRTRVYSTRFVDSAFTISLGWASLGYMLSLAGAYVLACVYSEVDGIGYLTAVAALAGAANTITSVPTGIFVRKMRGREIFLRTAVGRLTGLSAMLVLAMQGGGAWAIVWGTAISALTMALAAFSFTTRLPHLRLWPEYGRQIFTFGIQISLENFLWGTSARLFWLLFGHFHGVAALGLFQFALRLVDETANLLQAITNRLGLSYFATLVRQNQEVRAPFLNWSRFACIISFPVMGGLILFAPALTGLFSESWSEATIFVQIVAFGWLLAFPRIFIGPILRARNQQKIMVFNAAVSAVIMVGSVLVLATFGPIVASVGWISRQFYDVVWGGYISSHYIGANMQEQLRIVLSSTVSLVSAMAVVTYLSLGILVEFTLFPTIYLVVICIMETKLRRRLVSFLASKIAMRAR